MKVYEEQVMEDPMNEHAEPKKRESIPLSSMGCYNSMRRDGAHFR